MRQYCWIYEDLIKGDLVLVQKPHRRSVVPMFQVLAPVFRRSGFRPDQLICESASMVHYKMFRKRYKYVGGLNTRQGTRK